MAEEITTSKLSAPGNKPEAGEEAITPELAAASTRPIAANGTWEQVRALGSYMTRTEVHTYAF
ncbi:MAG: YihY/virulence factor BrkB family protein, partial [Bryocella sp.]